MPDSISVKYCEPACEVCEEVHEMNAEKRELLDSLDAIAGDDEYIRLSSSYKLIKKFIEDKAGF
jgi:hypothetical protein